MWPRFRQDAERAIQRFSDERTQELASRLLAAYGESI